MQLSEHDQSVLAKMNGAGWVTQHALKTSRQTLNKLVGAKLVERKITHDRIRYLPETGTLYRLQKMDDNNGENSCDGDNGCNFTARMRNSSGAEFIERSKM